MPHGQVALKNASFLTQPRCLAQGRVQEGQESADKG